MSAQVQNLTGTFRIMRVVVEGLGEYKIGDEVLPPPGMLGVVKTIKDLGCASTPGMLAVTILFTDGSQRQIHGRPFLVDMEEKRIVPALAG